MARIVCTPGILHGRPRIDGTRIGVAHVLGLLASGATLEQVLDAYPDLTREDVLAALDYARAHVSDEELRLLDTLA